MRRPHEQARLQDRAAPRGARVPHRPQRRAAAASGGLSSTYTTTTLKVPNQHWTVDEWAGRHAVARAAGATIVSNTVDTLTLQAPGWSLTVPAAGSPYTISGMAGDVGVVVELGNSLQTSNRGVANANAVNATAQVKPSTRRSLWCSTSRTPRSTTFPFEVHNADGTTTLVSATPTGADRVLVRTGVSNTTFTADFPIDASVRQISPAMQTFLQQVAFGDGAGHGSTDSVTSGTSAFRELARVYPADNNAHGSGSDYPTTPGHYDTPPCAD